MLRPQVFAVAQPHGAHAGDLEQARRQEAVVRNPRPQSTDGIDEDREVKD